MQLFTYWFLIPILFGLTFAGLGLLVRRVSRDLAVELIFPVGIAAAIVLSAGLTFFSWTAALCAPVLLIGAAAGWALTLRTQAGDLIAAIRRHATWIVAGLAGFAAFGASVVLSGAPSYTGYTQIVDIAHQFDIAAWLAQHGRDLPVDAISSSEGVILKTLGGGYPSGSQAMLGSYARFTGLEMSWMYQPFLALIAGSLVPTLALLLRPVVASARFRAVGAFTAAQGSILIGYAQIGGIKELLTAMLVALAAGTATRLRGDDEDRSVVATVLPVALAAAAAFSVLSLTTLPWLGLVAIGALVYAARSAPLRVLAIRGAVAVALFAVLAAPSIQAATKTGGAVSVVQNDAEIGNLAAPVGHLAASGIWFTGDHRYPIADSRSEQATNVIGGVTVLLAIAGLGYAWRRKARELVILASAGVVGLGVIIYVFSPWIELKGMAVMAPISLLLAVTALSAPLSSRRLRPVAWIGLAALLAAVLVADGQRYRGAVLAPHDRLQELADVGHDYAGQGPLLLPDFEEQGEFLTRAADGVSPVNASPKYGFPIRPEVAKLKPGVQLQWDLDEIDPEFVQRFPLLVTRRTPDSSRAPGNYDLVKSGRYYNVWKRNATPPPTEHIPLSSAPASKVDQGACRTFIGRNDAASVTVASAPVVYSANFVQRDVSLNLPVMNPQQMGVAGPGYARGVIDLPKGGRYELYFATNAYRETTLKIDDRKIASYADATYALRPDYIATLDLKAGRHRVELIRGGGTLAPGTFDPPGHVLGPVYLVGEGQIFPPPTTTPGAEASCPSRIDWLETRK